MSNATEMAFMTQFRDKKYGRKRYNPQRVIGSPSSDIRSWLPDSGATSHFTFCVNDSYDVEDCHRPVTTTTADGSTIYATKRGKVAIQYRLDQGQPSSLELVNVYYVPGLYENIRAICSEVE